MTDNLTPNDIALLREALAGAFRLVDGIAGAMNGVSNEPTNDQADVIAGDLAELLSVPFDENWPAAAAAALAPGQHDGAAGEGNSPEIPDSSDFNADEHGDIVTIAYMMGAKDERARQKSESGKHIVVPAPTEQARAEGYVLVPREPTEAMVYAAYQHVTQRLCELGDKAEMRALYAAMLAAAGDDAVGGGDE